MHEKKSFYEDRNKTGISAIISSKGGKTHVVVLARAKAGEELTKMEAEDASEDQVAAICDIISK